MTRIPAKAEPSAPTDAREHAGGPTALDARAKRRVERAAGDLRRGTPVVVTGARAAVLALTVETAEPEGQQLLAARAGGVPELAVTAMRARALGLEVPADAAALRLRLHGGPGADGALALADPTGPEAGRPPRIAGQELAGAPTVRALELAKLARLLPAALVAPVPGEDADAWEAWAAEHDLIAVPAADVAAYRARAAADLHPVASARVPLAGAEDATVHAFRPHDGGPEHFAIVIGAPSGEAPVLTRLHSECFTGDLLASLRCDCGDQLRGAIEAIAEAGSGVLLYLAQEGRGIGLVNKLRAYQLQDAGADTLEANTQLGFDADERVYLPAAEMLRRLGFDRVRLMTNNPEKVEALAACGIEVSERVPHHFPSNDHNELYLDTKARRFGHLY